MERRLFALLEFRDERRFLEGWVESVAPEVDGFLAIDDGSADGGAAALSGHPKLLGLLRQPRRPPQGGEVRDGAVNRRALHQAAGDAGATGTDWLVAIDADERPEIGFGVRARREIDRLEGEGILAASVWIRELWDRPDRVRVDGRWGEKRHARFYRWSADAEHDPRPLHGHWAPLDLRTGGGYPPADLFLYHLRMIHRVDREARRVRFERLDPERVHQSIGYAHLTDESGLALAPVPEERSYRGI